MTRFALDCEGPNTAVHIDAGFDEQGVSERDQTIADSDQTSADFDQTASDIEQTASERDQRASDRDQRAADRDQARADDSAATGASADDRDAAREDSRRVRSQTTLNRAISSEARNRASAARLTSADIRDRDADARDADADARDALAAVLDAQFSALEGPDIAASGGSSGAGAHELRARQLAAEARERSARLRRGAAHDRAAARADRVRAAEDRRVLDAELQQEGLDHLTGALRRRRGLDMLERELERTQRTRDTLTVAFVDINGLKRVNDEQGHDAGDAVLQAAAQSISRLLRPYDGVMRFGGDEFVCVLSGRRLPDLQERFDQVAAEMAERCNGTSITVGLAEVIAGETPQDLIVRADRAMLATRASHSGR